jgi:hypothetical protein
VLANSLRENPMLAANESAILQPRRHMPANFGALCGLGATGPYEPKNIIC